MNTVDLFPEINRNFERVLKSDLFDANDFPKPSQQEHHSKTSLSLFDFAGIEMGDKNENAEEE